MNCVYSLCSSSLGWATLGTVAGGITAVRALSVGRAGVAVRDDDDAAAVSASTPSGLFVVVGSAGAVSLTSWWALVVVEVVVVVMSIVLTGIPHKPRSCCRINEHWSSGAGRGASGRAGRFGGGAGEVDDEPMKCTGSRGPVLKRRPAQRSGK